MTGVWRRRWGEIAAQRMLADIGTTSLTGLRPSAISNPKTVRDIAHPVYQTVVLSAADASSLGSDFQRVGFVHNPRDSASEEFIDSYGVGWLVTDGFPAPFHHPLQEADWHEIPRHPKPLVPARLQFADPVRDDLLTVLDPPCPGLLDTCFMLRNAWQFMDDLTSDWRKASALLDWAMEVVEKSYQTCLSAMPVEPDLIVYGDDLGFQSGMYLSDVDFRNFLLPRMQTLFARLRHRTSAPICLHSCGAVRSIVGDLAGLDVDMLNLDFYAKGMIMGEVRKQLPTEVILHAPVNLAAVGRAVVEGNKATLALLATEIAAAMPAIAAPIDNIATAEDLFSSYYGIAFARALDAGDLATLRNVGPVRSIIEKAQDLALKSEMPSLAHGEIPIGILEQSSTVDTRPKPRSTPVQAPMEARLH